jgi:predicted CXXCH cytochrome family protein
MAPEGEKPGLFEAEFSVECVTCHDPHGSGIYGQLRMLPGDLCADCHNMEGAIPTEEPLQPHTEMLRSYGGYYLDFTPMEGPYSDHYVDNPKECATCHVRQHPHIDADNPVDSGHLFIAKTRSCEPCHSEATAEELIDMAHEEFSIRMNLIARYLDPGDPLYVDPTELPPAEQAQYFIAKFDYEMVAADKSFGSHSPAYGRALLAEAETFFGIPPWMWLLHAGYEQLDDSTATSSAEVRR